MGDDRTFFLIMGALIVMGILYGLTDFEIGPVVEIDKTSEKQQVQVDEDPQVAGSNTNPAFRDVFINRVHETSDLTTKQEEANKDRNPDYNGDEENEYIILKADKNNTHSVNVTGWSFENSWGTVRETIGQARVTINKNQTRLQDIVLQPGDTLYVMSGEHPRDWFPAQLNICHGYFNEKFDNELNVRITKDCPPIDETFIPVRFKQDAQCMKEIRSQRTCEKPEDISRLITSACYDYIFDLYSYGTCVENNYTSPDFQKGVWFYYLDVDDPIWDVKNDGVFLYDKTDELVDMKVSF